MLQVLAQEAEISWVGAWALVLFLAVTMFGGGWLVLSVARRAADGRADRNWAAGIRTSATMSSDEAWVAAHIAGEKLTARAGWVAMVCGVASVPVAGLIAVFGGPPDIAVAAALAVSTGIGCVGLLGFAVGGAIQGHRAAVEVRDRTVDQQR